MKFQTILVPIGAIALLILAYQSFGGQGIALVLGGLLMYALLNFTRMMTVFKRASSRPVGFVESAVMLNAKLRTGVNLLHVIAMTRSLGQPQSAKDAQPELFRWTDAGGSHVTCVFSNGKLTTWTLWRPTQDDAPDEAAREPEAQA